MRFMFIRRADEHTEAGAPPAPGVFDAMDKYHQQMAAAGILIEGVGLKPSRFGARITVSAGGVHSKTDGPFAETKELIAGYWVWKVKNMDEAVSWLKRAPFDGGTEIEIRPIFEAEDFGKEFTPELRAQEDRLRAEMESKK